MGIYLKSKKFLFHDDDIHLSNSLLVLRILLLSLPSYSVPLRKGEGGGIFTSGLLGEKQI